MSGPEPGGATRGLLTEIGASVVGPALAFAVLLGRLVLPPEAGGILVVPALFLAVTLGAAFGGRRSAVASAGLAGLGLVLWSEGGSLATGVVVAVALGIALVVGELRARAERAERATGLAQTRLRRLAMRDQLTGLLDRRGFEDALTVDTARESRRGGRLAILLFELSPLALVNERLGRSVGDTLLQVFADSLEQRIRQSDVAARIGGDEFAVILADADRRGARIVAHEVIAHFRADVDAVIPHDLGITARFGIASFPDDGRSIDVLLNAAGVEVAAADSGPEAA